MVTDIATFCGFYSVLNGNRVTINILLQLKIKRCCLYLHVSQFKMYKPVKDNYLIIKKYISLANISN